MRKQGYGKIIQHSSILGLVSMPFRGVYNASKYAIEGLSDTLRLDLHDTNIHISLLNTGPVESSFRKNAIKSLDNLNIEQSKHKERYLKAKSGQMKKVPFSLKADSVASVVHKIVLDDKPKPRYYITKASYILAFLKRILPTDILDRLLMKI